MNTNGFFSNSGIQSATAERFKPLFQSSSSADVKRDLQSFKSDAGLNLNVNALSGNQVFSKSIEFSLGVRFESSYEFKLPSPKDVAKTVLGFVENRISSEKQAGASIEKLNDLMAQARSGIEKGFAQAEKDINDLGLMTESLSEDISEGYKVIESGLDKIDSGLESNQSFNVASFVDEQLKDDTSDTNVQSNGSLGGLFAKAEPSLSDQTVTQTNSSKLISLDQFTQNKADFVLNTQEGDQILIRLSDSQSLRYAKSEQGEVLESSQSARFEFAINGDLNESETQAINDLLDQVDTIASLFFNDQFESAFSAALNLGFDSEQIASFSLDLSKLQVQEVRSYQDSSSSALDAYKRNQPLINVAQQFEKFEALLEPLARFDEVNALIESLLNKALENYASETTDDLSSSRDAVNNYSLFSGKLFDAVLSGSAQ